MLSNHTLVLGGAASGKSAAAETHVLRQTDTPLYIATAQIYDAEMQAKIDAHRLSRGPIWETVEEPVDLPRALTTASAAQAVLIDCATLWLTNLLMAEADIEEAEQALFAALDRAVCPVTIVSNEVGQGIVPDNAMARHFRGLQGRFNQRLAARAGTVWFVTAGLVQCLKGSAS